MRTAAGCALIAFLFISCETSKDEFPEQVVRKDSLSKIEQNRKNDSLKKQNPLLILPPDSDYTGTYVDRYPNGIVKFSGYFRFGKRHGQWMSFFPNGEKWSEMH